MIDEQNINVIEINKENNTFLCDNGIEYPLFNSDTTIEELQIEINKAKIIIKNIISDGEAAES